MTYTDSARNYLREDKIAIVKDELAGYIYDSYPGITGGVGGWKKVLVLNPETQAISIDSSGSIMSTYPTAFDYEDGALALTVTLTTEDSSGNPIVWNFKTSRGANTNKRTVGQVTLVGNKLSITPQSVIDIDGNDRITATGAGQDLFVNIYTDDSPSFYIPQFTDSPQFNFDNNGSFMQKIPPTMGNTGYRREQGRYEAVIRYNYDDASIQDFNTFKILDLLSFGSAKVYYSSTNISSRLTNSTGMVYKTGILPNGYAEPTNRIYVSRDNNIRQFENPRTNSLAQMNSSTNNKGTYTFRQRIVDDIEGTSISNTGDKMYVLSTDATGMVKKTIVEYNLDSIYDIRSSVYRSSTYNDIYIGGKAKFLNKGKYLYTMRWYPQTTEYSNFYWSGYFAPSNVNVAGYDWPLLSRLWRYTIDSDYTGGLNTGKLHTTRDNFDQNILLRDYRKEQLYLQYGYLSTTQRQFTGGVQYGGAYFYYPHVGAITGFDMDPTGQHLYLVSSKAQDKGSVRHIKWFDGNNYNITGAIDDNEDIDHNIGVGTVTNYLANFKTNGAWDIKVSNDGMSIFILDTSSKAIYQYNMTTAHSLPSLNRTELQPISKTIDNNGYDAALFLTDIPATASNPPPTFSQEISSNLGIKGLSNIGAASSRQFAAQNDAFRDFSMIRSMAFNNDGSRLYVHNDHALYRYNLSTPFNLSTATFIRSTEKFRSDMINYNHPFGVGIALDSDYGRFYITNNRYSLVDNGYDEGTAQGVIKEFVFDPASDSLGNATPPYTNRIIALDSDNWRDIHLNSDGTKIYVSGPNKIKILTMSSAGIISTVTTDSNYAWDSAVKFSGEMITTSKDENDIYVSDSSNTIRMVTLTGNIGANGTINHVGKNFTTVAPSPNNSEITGMEVFQSGKAFIISGNQKIEHYKSRDSNEFFDG